MFNIEKEIVSYTRNVNKYLEYKRIHNLDFDKNKANKMLANLKKQKQTIYNYRAKI